MKTRQLYFLALLVTIALGALFVAQKAEPVTAQEPQATPSNTHRYVQVFGETYYIEGYVDDNKSIPLSGITIHLEGGNLQSPITTTTDEEGFYFFDGLEAGDYVISATDDNYNFTPGPTSLTLPPDQTHHFVGTASGTGIQPDIRIEPSSLSFDLTGSRARHAGGIPVETEPLSQLTSLMADKDGLLLDFNLPMPTLNSVSEQGQTFQRLVLPDEGMTDEVGRPQLPVLSRWLAIPPGHSATVQVLSATYTMDDGYHIYPAQPPVADSEEDPPFEIDRAFYGRDIFYPQSQVWLEPPTRFRGFDATALRVYPFQYNPKTGQLKHYTHIRVKVNFVQTGPLRSLATRLRSPHFDELYSQTMINYDQIAPPISPQERNRSGQNGADMVIITAPQFESAANTLAEWRTQRGIKTVVRTTDQTGQTADAIQTYIKNAYTSWSPAPSFVLLLGDAEFIPPHYGTRHSSHDYSRTGTDLYYATVDGDDYFPDISIGRIPIDTAEQALQAVNKIINYEKTPVTDPNFYKRVAIAAEFQDYNNDGYADRRFLHTSEEIRDLMERQGYDAERIYYTEPGVTPTNYDKKKYSKGEPLPADLLRSNGFAWNRGPADISQAVNEGVFILNHRDHGGPSGWSHPEFRVHHVSNLTNGNKLPIVFSVNCATGWFDNETDEQGARSAPGDKDIVFAESWLRNPNGGAVGVVAATRNTYSGHNDAMVKGFYDAIWPNFLPPHSPPSERFANPQRRMGHVMNYGKLYYASQYRESKGRKIEFEAFHYFGDPAMQIWTGSPTLVQKSFTIHNDGQADLVVSDIRKQDDSCWLDVNATLPLTVTQGASVDITVAVDGGCATGGTNSDRLLVISNDPDESPYPDGVDVELIVPSLNDVGFADSDVDTDDGGGGNGDEDPLHPGDEVTLVVELDNAGNDTVYSVTAQLISDSPYVTITDETAFYPELGPQQNASNNDDTFVFIISEEIPAPEVIVFTMITEDSEGGRWDDIFAFIVQPDTTPPNEPSNPSPADEVSDQPSSLTLSWEGGDPDDDSVTYDVYVETEHAFRDLASSTVATSCLELTTPECNLSGLAPGTTYFWYVIATDQHGAESDGPVWIFRTTEDNQLYLPLITSGTP